MEKHYVYSARTTEDGLAVLNKAKGNRSWDTFINEAVAEHYKLDPTVINLPPSKFLQERAERKAAKDAEKAKKASGKKAKVKVEKKARKAAKQTAEPQPN